MALSPLCYNCGINPKAQNKKYCKECHNSYMRNWRQTHRLEGLPLMKSNCRSHSNTLLKRGKLKKMPCQKCQNEKSQMHHEDYTKPAEVTWLCRKCHEQLHKERKEQEQQSIFKTNIA